MMDADWFDLPLEELAQRARAAIGEGDSARLEAVDGVLRHHLRDVLAGDSTVTKEELMQALLAVQESPEARGLQAPQGAARQLIRWDTLLVVLDGLREKRDRAAEARQVVRSRERGEELLRLVDQAGSAGITQRELAEGLGISVQNLHPLLVYLESYDIVVRRKQGRHSFVRLGAAGTELGQGPQVVLTKPQSASPRAAFRISDHSGRRPVEYLNPVAVAS